MLTNIFRKKPEALTLDQLRILQHLSQQAVFSGEGHDGLSHEKKRQLARNRVIELLEELGICAPLLFIDVSIEASFLLMKRSDSKWIPLPLPSPS